MTNRYELKKFTQDIGVIGVSDLVLRLSGLALIAILTKTLGAHGYGLWSQAMVTIELIQSLATLGLPYTLVRFLAAENNKKEIQEGFFSVITLIFFVTLAIAFLLITFSDIFAERLFDGASEVVKMVALIILVDYLGRTCLSIFRAFRQMKKYSAFVIGRSFAELGLIAYAVFSGFGIYGVLISVLIVRILLFFIVFCLISSKIGFKLPNFSRIREYLDFGLPTIPGNLSSWVVGTSDRYIIAYFLGVLYVGIYSPAYALGNVITMFLAPLGFVLPPTLSKLYDEGNNDDVRTILQYSLKYFLLLAIPSVFGLSLLSKQLLMILSTSEISSQGYLVVPFVAVSNLLYGAYVIIVHILVLVKKTKIIGSSWIIAALANLCLNIVFVPYIGIIGAAITTLIAYFIAFILITYFSFRSLRFSIDWKFIMKSVFASVIMSLLITKGNPIEILDVLIEIGICAVVYAAVLLLLKGITKEEIAFFKELFRI